jgi:protoporphyrinogen oxidase
LEELIQAGGGEILTGVSVRRILLSSDGGLWVEVDQARQRFDKVIFTGPVNILQRVAARELLDIANGDAAAVEYLGVLCMALVTQKPLVPYYVVNIADKRIPFTGVIGMSNVVAPGETAGRCLTYLPKYVLSTDPLLQRPDEELCALFFNGLRLMFPDLKIEEIERVHLNRAVKVQPLQVLNYSSIVPKVATAHPDFFVLNTSQFVHGTLNNNEVIATVDAFLNEYGARIEQASHSKNQVSVRHALMA